VQLPAADIERDHPSRTALEQNVRESAGRRADVQRITSGRIDPELVERMRELVAAARDVPRRLLDDELRRVVYLLPGFRVAANESRHDERLRLRAALGESALNKQHVQALAHERKASLQSRAF
jgi:hypothetical protein